MSKSRAAAGGDTDDESEANGPVSSFQSLAAEADILAKQGDYRKAIDAFTKALSIRPTDKTCLVSRSKCYLQLGDAQIALVDADASLKEDPNFFKGVFQKAEALYATGDFEMALVYYHRGNKLRPELEEFRLGIQKAREAIDNSIGNPRDYKLHSPGSWVGGVLEKAPATAGTSGIGGMMGGKPGAAAAMDRRTTGAGAAGRGAGTSGYGDRGARLASSTAKGGGAVGTGGGFGGLSGVSGPGGIGAPAVSAGAPAGPAAPEKSVKQLLGELYADKEYLQKLYDDRDLANNSKIYELVTEGLRYLDTRTEFWRQQKPMYARKKEHSRILAKASHAKQRREALRAQKKEHA